MTWVWVEDTHLAVLVATLAFSLRQGHGGTESPGVAAKAQLSHLSFGFGIGHRRDLLCGI